MSYKTRVYKTMKGFLKAVGDGYVSADKFFAGKHLCGTSRNLFYAVPSDELRAEVAKAFEKDHWSRSNHARLNALMSGHGADFSFLQCFYVTRKEKYNYCYGTSLSGDAYDYCKRMFTESAY